MSGFWADGFWADGFWNYGFWLEAARTEMRFGHSVYVRPQVNSVVVED